jgi:hypothetical protein
MEATVFGQVAAYKQYTCGSAAVFLFPTADIFPAGQQPVDGALISIGGSSGRLRMDGTNPTTTVGHPSTTGDIMAINGVQNLINFRFLSDGSTTLDVSFVR